MDSILLPYLTAWKPLAYAIIFLGMILEGDALLFIAGFLTHQGVFELLPILATVCGGVFIGDNLWFELGVRWKNSSSRLMQWVEKLAKPFDLHLQTKPLRTIFISKFTYGFNHAILVRAGILGIRWKKLEESVLLADLFWIFIVGGLGYLSSASFARFKHILGFTEAALALGLAGFIFLELFLTRQSKKKL